jgi:hypothetical protein
MPTMGNPVKQDVHLGIPRITSLHPHFFDFFGTAVKKPEIKAKNILL